MKDGKFVLPVCQRVCTVTFVINTIADLVFGHPPLFGQAHFVMPLIETPLTQAWPATHSIVWGVYGVWIGYSVDTVVVIICF